MIQCRSGVGLLFEACPAGRIGRDLGRENLQRNVATKTRVARPIHFSHPASAKRADNFIRTQTDASQQGHWKVRRSSIPDELAVAIAKERDTSHVGSVEWCDVLRRLRNT